MSSDGKMTAEEIEAAFGQIRKLCADAGVWRLKGSSWDHADRLQAHLATLQREADEMREALEPFAEQWRIYSSLEPIGLMNDREYPAISMRRESWERAAAALKALPPQQDAAEVSSREKK
jgi:hypothetical protein